jgi:site-specific recombinase XerD
MENTALIQINENDKRMVEMWLHGRSANTQRAYIRSVNNLFAFTGKSLQEITLQDLQHFSDSLTTLNDTSKSSTLNGLKSLFSFAHELGYIPFNTAVALKPPKVRSQLAQRILTEEQTINLISATRDNKRNHALLRLMYHCGLRVSEVCGLTWSDVVERSEGGQISVWGKGSKERNILVVGAMWEELQGLRGDSHLSDFVFRSRKGDTRLTERQVERLVIDAARKAEIPGNVSPHWLRHAHASHSLDRGANINLVRDTLGHASLATTGKYTHARPNASSSQYLPL